MTDGIPQERLDDLAEQLEYKAERIEDGFYGEDDDNDSWAADLRRAAKRLRKNLLDELNPTDLEEIECGTDADTRESRFLKNAGSLS